MNYSGDLVCTPADVARMQRGEGLHLANVAGGNLQTSLVYDRELLEGFAGVDLPWSDGDIVARAGVEYRNDLLGHVHGSARTRRRAATTRATSAPTTPRTGRRTRRRARSCGRCRRRSATRTPCSPR